ncbi:MAG: phosphotransferase enzyme family protein [Dehalococcoidia bacterium]
MTLEVIPAAERRAHGDHRAIAEVLDRFSLMPVAPPEPVPGSSVNHNYHAVTHAGPRFVRIHRANKSRTELEAELQLLAWCQQAGLPVIQPLAGPGGRIIFSASGQLVTVWPWLDAPPFGRARASTTAGAAALGALQGSLDATLSGYDGAELPHTRQSWSTEDAVARLSRVDDLIRYYPAPGDEQLRLQAQLRAQLALLEGGAADAPESFAGLPTGPAHGDFHDRNVLVDAHGQVAAVVDWDAVCIQPVLYELCRVLALVCDVEPALVDAYVGAYAARRPIDPHIVAASIEHFWQVTLHSTWLYDQRFIEGDRRVEVFFESRARTVTWFAEATNRAWLAARIIAAAS